MYQRGLITPTLTASEHALMLLKKYYPKINIDTPLVHTYIPLRKTSFEKHGYYLKMNKFFPK